MIALRLTLIFIRESDKDIVLHEGLVYRKSFYDPDLVKGYHISEDLTDIVKGAVNEDDVQGYLKLVEDLTGKDIRTDYLTEIRKSIRLEVDWYKGIYLSFNEDGGHENSLRKFGIDLSVSGDINCGLADVSYEGKINP